MEIYPKDINEFRYLNDKEKVCAVFEYDLLKDSISVNYPKKKIKIVFNSKNPKEIQSFWDNLIRSSWDKKLDSLENILNEMKEKFIVKN